MTPYSPIRYPPTFLQPQTDDWTMCQWASVLFGFTPTMNRLLCHLEIEPILSACPLLTSRQDWIGIGYKDAHLMDFPANDPLVKKARSDHIRLLD